MRHINFEPINLIMDREQSMNIHFTLSSSVYIRWLFFIAILLSALDFDAWASPPNLLPSTQEAVINTDTDVPSVPDHSAIPQQDKEITPNQAALEPAAPVVRDSSPGIDNGYKEKQIGISGNPGAVNILTGTGKLGELMGLTPDSGARLGGLWIVNADLLMSGKDSGSSTFNNLGIIDLQLDMQTLMRIPGGRLGASFLQFNGQDSNGKAGVMTGYDGLTEAPPLDRSELYQLWWRQALLDERLIVRIGKSVPTFDFNNVSSRLNIPNEEPYVANVSGLLFTPIFVNPSILGVMPGYYNSAWGMTVTAAPTTSSYASYGLYDGSGATGIQTGIQTFPAFNSYYFNIGEIGTSWAGDYPGKISLGGWAQSGTLTTVNAQGQSLQENGARGIYATASNRLATIHMENGTGAIIGYLQYGINDSRTMMVNEYVGGGLTGFGLIPMRPKDSLGLGIGSSWLTNPSPAGKNETLMQMYYQAHIFGDVFLQPTFTYIPNPSGGAYPSATSLIFQLVTLF